ncbi:hypothetical protein FW774_05915 [Pedobacter sp. BS3]|uniref:hypothetical protein n=1 Tax=Pedobacter sp. BS3 TaxID=2567937 RepID=UPI0011EDD837|nr:hypothetical protein [Pedobacter sp. BS3]TZF84523.1 hypothetical protein FW774_05915 [Pedobacter sp. BS3]
MVTELIRSIVSTLPNEPTFVLGHKAWQNFVSDNNSKKLVIWPAVYMEDLLTSDDRFESSMAFTEFFNIEMMFLDRKRTAQQNTALDATPEQEEPVIYSMRELRRLFLTRLARHEAVNWTAGDGITNIKTINVKKWSDASLSGCVLTFRLKLFNEYSFCDD